ncbi:nuclear transport factor 2 family protein [Streptomyces sp. NPDC046942]|uniref:nuclear transport factor 2 family protein n=1 Tax=Streptomyces sp. NPDC046942 TaxID=3155137 RepID=UPI0033E29CC3
MWEDIVEPGEQAPVGSAGRVPRRRAVANATYACRHRGGLAPTDPEAWRHLVTGLRAADPHLHTIVERVIAEDDLVLLHTHAMLEPGSSQAVVDIFRVRDGKIVEHWDVMQQVPESSVNGNDMFSTVSVRAGHSPDLDASTAENKQIASALFHEVTVGRDVTAYDRYAAAPLHQHNPQSPNGIAAAKEQFTSAFAAHPDLSVSVKRVIADGEYVAFHHHFQISADDRGAAVVDIFRIQDHKVVEHWDVVQPVPATSANDNTMF